MTAPRPCLIPAPKADIEWETPHLRITEAGVFWPLTSDPLFDLVGTFPFPSSDHRMVWLDLAVPGRAR